VVRLIVLDQLRQMRAAYLMIGALVTLVWLAFAGGPRDMSLVVAFSILWACVAGPLMTFTNLARKEFTVLPVSRRQLWQARWLLGTVIPVAVTATGAAVALAMAPVLPVGNQAHLDTFILAALCEFAYLGVISGLLVLLSRRRSRLSPWRGGDRAIDALALVVLIGGFFGGEFLIRPYLPVRWADLRSVTGVVLAAGVALAVASYFHSPGRGGRAFARLAPGAKPRTAAGSALRQVSRLTSGFVSILWIILGWCVFASVIVAIVGLLAGNPFRGLQNHTALWIIMAIFITRPDWRSRLRALRTLPIGTSKLNAMLLGTSAALWLSVWATLAILHVLVPGRVGDILRPEWIAGLIGLSMLGVSFDLQSRWAIKGAMLALALALIVGSARYLHVGSTMVWPAWILLGVAALSAAALLNHYALTRSSSIYKPDKSALSFARL
jgi:hypothetical protein